MDKIEQAEYLRRYRYVNGDELRLKRRQHYAAHKAENHEKRRQYNVKHRDHINARARQYRYMNGEQSMAENRMCSVFLGVHVAERMLAHFFKDVIRMPINNPGYDFICNNGYKIDVKSACARKGDTRWSFTIRHNTIADFFLCIAFNDRERLDPQHVWLIPGNVLSHKSGVSISESMLDRWAQYEKLIDGAVVCCNIMKGV